MSQIHVQLPGGATRQYSEIDFSRDLQSGQIQPGSMYWKEGMQEWRPVSEHASSPLRTFSEGPAVANPYQASATPNDLKINTGSKYRPGPDGYVKNPVGLTYFVLVMLGISLLWDFLSIGSSMMQLSLLASDFTQEEADANDAREVVVALSYTGVYIITAIGFLMWVYRAAVNSRGFGAQRMENSPGWAVGWYFIPLMNWFKPYQAMKEIWQVSLNPQQWRTQPVSPLLGFWWGLWLLAGVMGQIVFRMPTDTIDELVLYTQVDIGASIVGIPLNILLFLIVKGIADRHRDLAEQVAHSQTAPSTQYGTPQNPFAGF